jgi:mRNA-degrading endonuclease HigB of HigAB toxin-antitoxin module
MFTAFDVTKAAVSKGVVAKHYELKNDIHKLASNTNYTRTAIDINGNEICEIKYDYVWDFENGYTIVNLNNKWGAINEQGEEIINIKYVNFEINDILDKYIKNHNRNLKLNKLI